MGAGVGEGASRASLEQSRSHPLASAAAGAPLSRSLAFEEGEGVGAGASRASPEKSRSHPLPVVAGDHGIARQTRAVGVAGPRSHCHPPSLAEFDDHVHGGRDEHLQSEVCH